ncbi:hypothetical protein [Ralstonia solanacearum]|uniref:hypothetical protein n=2 Tax=Ralstonia TaxID=48736 RepID=UPI000B968A7E|nr:hypothetical protein [Ralstonia solanacearum]OYQ04646.1 hypothetical protein B7R79_00045 [Ralstonia solanacearum]
MFDYPPPGDRREKIEMPVVSASVVHLVLAFITRYRCSETCTILQRWRLINACIKEEGMAYSEIKEPNGRTIYKFTGSEIKEPNGKVIFKITSNEIRSPSGSTLYKFTGDEIKAVNGTAMYKYTGSEIKAPNGSILFMYSATELKKPNGSTLFKFSGRITVPVLFALGLI